MNGTLPTPVLQGILNSSRTIFVTWRPLNDNALSVLVKLFDNSGLIQTDTVPQGQTPYSLLPNQPLNNPPYTIRLAATDGTNTGPDSPAAPVIIFTPVVGELTYDTVKVAVTLKSPSPPPPPDTYYIMTIFEDGNAANSPPFTGLKGEGPLDHAPATAECHAFVTANQDTSQGGQFTCTSTGPSSATVGIITQPATIDRVQYFSNTNVQIDATGPNSVGPPINGHRSFTGNAICSALALTDFTDAAGVVKIDFDGEKGVMEFTADVDPAQPVCVIAAGTSRNGDTISVGPFSAPLQIITQAPAFLSLMSTTASKLIANWSAVTLPNSAVRYIVQLYRDSILIDSQSTSDLHFLFGAQFEGGRVYTFAVQATANQDKVIGPLSGQGPGPFKSSAPAVVYDSLGRLFSMSITGYRKLTYTMDDFGNITNAKVSDNNA
jgi:hypothetical protein